MNAITVTQTIQLIIAPVVMLTGCGLILNGLLARYTAIGNRLRALTHERLDLLRAHETEMRHGDPFYLERLNEIDRQLPTLLARFNSLRNTVVLIFSSIAVFVADMFVIAGAALSDHFVVASAALGIFLIGAAVLFVSVIFAAREVSISHGALEYEVQRVSSLGVPSAPNE